MAEKKKIKAYLCLACGKTKKASRKAKCCSKDMVAKKRGSWNM